MKVSGNYINETTTCIYLQKLKYMYHHFKNKTAFLLLLALLVVGLNLFTEGLARVLGRTVRINEA